MLLNSTDVSFVQSGTQSPTRSQQNRTAVKQPSSAASQVVPQQLETSLHTPNSTPSNNASATPARPGPAVIIPQLSQTTRREEYRRYDAPETGDGLSKKKERIENETPTVKSREREIADKKTAELYALVDEIAEDRDTSQSEFFRTMETDDAEVMVLRSSALSQLSEAVTKVVNLGCFEYIPTKRVLVIQSLCEPLITATSQLSLHLTTSDDEDFVGRLSKAQSGLRACRLVLQTMTEGCDDRRICSEDRVQGVVRLLKHILSSCIIPVVESRRSGSSSELFNAATQHRSEVYPVLRFCGTILSEVAALISKVKLSAFTLSPIESVSTEIIFAQNGDKESESALGIQKFESFRQKAMDVLAQVFACHPEQRDSIAGEILNNLERLPDKRANARQFRSARGTPIMLVSALFMRIVQAAASSSFEKNDTFAQEKSVDRDEESEEESDSESESSSSKRKAGKTTARTPSQIATELWNNAKRIASHIASTLEMRAENVSKSGDKPFRNLLDLFIEDLCNVLGSPEWPTASVFLEALLGIMVNIAQNENINKKGVQAADMAIAAMGSMGCGIIDFTLRMKNLKRNLDISQSVISSKLVPLAEDAINTSINKKDVLSLNGPYRAVLESLPGYLNLQGAQASRDDPHLRSLSGYYATSWANGFFQEFHVSDADEPRSQSVIELEEHLKRVVMDSNWLSKEYKFQNVTDTESQLAAGIIALQEPFCKYLQSLILRLLNNTRHESAKVKSRAMTSLTQMIEKDPKILGEQTFRSLAQLIKDNSPLVRENTVALISKCLEQDPSLERHCWANIIELMTDPANGPKKRAIKLLKDIYTSTTVVDKKLKIASELLLPIQDDDKSIADLARQTLEDIWLTPSRAISRTNESQIKLDREKRVSLLVDTVQNIQGRSGHLQAFETFFTTVLSATAKNSTENFKICKEMVADMFEGVIDTGSSAGEKSQTRILQTLSVLAKVDARLFTRSEVQMLKPYVRNLKTTDDLAVFRPTVIIFRYVFPGLPSLQETFLEEVRDSLYAVIAKLASQAAQGAPSYKETLLDVAHCSWIISPLLKGDSSGVKRGMEKLMHMICSILVQLEPLGSSSKEMSADEKKRIMSWMIILGTFGKVCDFDEDVDVFRSLLSKAVQKVITLKKATPEQLKRLTGWDKPSVAVLFLDTLLPFTKQTWDIGLREQALRSLGEVCQQKTKHFTRADIEKAFRLPFLNQDAVLIRVVLTQFRDFLATAERRSDTGAEIAVGEGAVHGAERLETSFIASDNDHATTHIARSFLSNIVDTALGKADDLAIFATEILVSISRQGLLHPKECGAALVALSTSPIPQIALKSSAEHHKIHLQHETMFEKEYVAAVTLAFQYQRDVFDDPHGAKPVDNTFKPKMQLLFDAFKSGNRKTLKKFISNIFRQLNFELPKLDSTGTIPEAALFARFSLENFAFFDYARVDEVIHTILTIESIVLKQTGPSVALAIETEMPDQQLEQPPPELLGETALSEPVPQHSTKATMTEERLRHLTVACMILHMMWETRTFLRRVYNLQGKLAGKDMQKPALRMYFITGKDLWERFGSIMAALDSSEAMKKQCNDLAEIINVDREHAVEEEDGDAADQLAMTAAGYETPDEGGEASAPTSGKGRKRKSTSMMGNTPKKPRNRPSGSKAKKRSSRTPEDSD